MAPRELNSGFFTGTIGQRFQPASGRDLAERDDEFGRGIRVKDPDADFASCASRVSLRLKSRDGAVSTPSIALVPRQVSVANDGGNDPPAIALTKSLRSDGAGARHY
jgi:hypothetical protein